MRWGKIKILYLHRFYSKKMMVIVAQLVRALDCGSRSRRFEPGPSPGF